MINSIPVIYSKTNVVADQCMRSNMLVLCSPFQTITSNLGSCKAKETADVFFSRMINRAVDDAENE